MLFRFSLPVLLLSLPARSQDPVEEPSRPQTDILSEAPAQGAGPFRVRIGPKATVRRLPKANGRIVEMYVRDTDVNLQSLLRGNTRDISSMDAMNLGGGTWLVRMQVRDERFDVEPQIVGEDLEFQIVPRRATSARLRAPAPSLDQLIAGEIPDAGVAGEGKVLFHILQGGALAHALQPWEYRPVLTRTPEMVLSPSWDRIDAARSAMLAAEEGSRKQAEQTYYLGYYYLMQGFGREARYYFSQVSARPGPIPQKDIALERARAALACGRWDEARDGFVESWRLGGHHDSIVEGLAVVSLATANPPRAPTGRLLWATTSDPGALMLAAELLQADGRMAESRYLLEGIEVGLPEDLIPRWALRLGDARFYDGAVQEAMAAWKYAPEDIRGLRELLFQLHQTGSDPVAWASFVPGLVQESLPRTDSGAEALYLLSQIDQSLMAREDAINDLATLLKRHPEKAVGSDVPERFWEVYARHIADLAQAGRWFDLAALHETVWERSVRRAVLDPRPLVSVAEAYDQVGLPDRAVVVLREAVSVLVARGVDEPALVLRLAELYAKTGNYQDGLDTLAYLDDMGATLADPAAVDLLAARLHLGAGQGARAAAALRKAAADPKYRDEATMLLAIMDAEGGQCRRAAPTLRRLLFVDGAEGRWTEPRPWMALARCLNLAGDTDGAARAARVAAEKTNSEVESRYARWLASMAEGWRDPSAVEALAKGDDIWASIAREQQAAASFESELDRRRETDWQRRNRLLGP